MNRNHKLHQIWLVKDSLRASKIEHSEKKIKRSLKEGKILIIANIFLKSGVEGITKRETWGSWCETPQRAGLQMVLDLMLFFTLAGGSREWESFQLKGVDVTQKVETIQHNFCIEKASMFTIIVSNFVLEQLKISKVQQMISKTLRLFTIIPNP